MGNNLRRIALYCDCLEKPWKQYEPQESEQTSKQEQQSTTSQNKPGSSKIKLEQKHIIFDVPLQDASPQINPPLIVNFGKDTNTRDDLDNISNETDLQRYKPKSNDMDIIDLQKIDPNLIKYEAKQLNQLALKNKLNKIPKLEVLQPKIPSNETSIRNRQFSNEDTLSNMFEDHEKQLSREQEKGKSARPKYFVEGEEEQYYQHGEAEYRGRHY